MTNKYTIHETGTRKWGMWEVLDVGTYYCLKRLILKENTSISKQRHNHRAETWIVIAGKGSVAINGEIFEANVGDVFYIPVYAIHQLSSSNEKISVIELQKGDILDENDIERFE